MSGSSVPRTCGRDAAGRSQQDPTSRGAGLDGWRPAEVSARFEYRGYEGVALENTGEVPAFDVTFEVEGEKGDGQPEVLDDVLTTVIGERREQVSAVRF